MLNRRNNTEESFDPVLIRNVENLTIVRLYINPYGEIIFLFSTSTGRSTVRISYRPAAGSLSSSRSQFDV